MQPQPWPDKRYKVIYADPPWSVSFLKETKETGVHDVPLPYPQMSDDELACMPVASLAQDDAMLFLWIVDTKLRFALELMEHWGFTYVTIAFVWHKKARTTSGENATMGRYTHKSCELCMLGRHGKCFIVDATQPQFVNELKREHSCKPDLVRTRIETMCGDVPRIELFARQKFDGWDTWGNEKIPTLQRRLL